MAEGRAGKMECKLCGSKDVIMIHKGTRDNPNINVYRCQKCTLKFLINECDKRSYYEKSNMYNGSMLDDAESRVEKQFYEDIRKAEEVKQLIDDKTVLDFGCGYGGAMFHMRKYAKYVKGVEWEEAARNYILSKGMEVVPELEEYKEKFDVITLFHVFEHLENPKYWLGKFRRKLNPGGVIFLEIPHAEDALLELYHCAEFADFTYWSPHLFLYNRKTIKMIADACNYKIVEMHGIQRYSIANHLYWLSYGKPGGQNKWKWLDDDFVKNWYEKKLEEKEVTDTLLAVLTPKETGDRNAL